ncbi:MAG: glycosyltransferase [Bdellovibrionales bacterium]|nr:glycosyltransferase [Bdellovibrionales bacterium]
MMIRVSVRVAHIITSLHGDGAQRMLYRVAAAAPLATCDLQHVVISLEAGGEMSRDFEKRGIPVYELGMARRMPSLKNIKTLQDIMKTERPSIIQGWMYHGNVVASLSKLFHSDAKLFWNIRRCVYDLRDDHFFTRQTIRLNAALSRFTDRIIYCAQLAADQHEHIGFTPRNRVVIPNGFNTERFTPLPGARSRLCEQLKIDTDTLIVGNVGRFHPQKDHETLLQAFAQVKAQCPKVHLVCVGREMTSENAVLSSWMRTLGIETSVSLLGVRADIPQLMSGFDIYCSSSVNEGFPNVLGEAMACGIPVVSTDVGASGEMLDGLSPVVPRRDAEALARVVCEVIAMSSEKRALLGEQAREKVLKHYSLERVVAMYQDLYTASEAGTNQETNLQV